MGMANHQRRLARLEAERSVTKSEQLFFHLHEWAEGAPVAFREGEDDDETIATMRADALDRLVAADKIEECDRDRVVFIVRTFVTPSRPEQLEPYRPEQLEP